MKKQRENIPKPKCMNLEGFDGRVTLQELFELRQIFEDAIGEYIDYAGMGASYEGNGFNIDFDFKGKQYIMRVELEERQHPRMTQTIK